MRRILGTICLAVLVSCLGRPARAADQDVNAILDKAMKALGGEEKLSKVNAISTKAKSVFTFNGNDSEFKTRTTIEGMEHYRGEFDGEFNGNKFSGVTVLNGKKGWRKFGDQDVMDMDDAAVANERRVVYLALVPMLIVPLKSKDFKVEAAGEEKVGDADTVVLKVTPPDGKTFKLFLNKETGLPAKQVATVMGFMGDEFTMDVFFDGYKDFDGIKKATKIESKRDGEKFQSQEVNEFKVLASVPADTFAEPK
jgi:hypothetical protein